MLGRWRDSELFTSIETRSKDFTSRTSHRYCPLLTLDSTVTGRAQEAGWSFSPPSFYMVRCQSGRQLWTHASGHRFGHLHDRKK